MKPQHTHDCDSCTFLGTSANYDLYHCGQEGSMPTVIARYGEDGSYKSGMYFASRDKELGEAKELAIAKGLPID